MTYKFEEFISESKIIEIINEGLMMASARFIDRLKKMSKKNEIADTLFDFFDDEYSIDKDLLQNWIDCEGEDTITFIPDKKINTMFDEYDGVDPYTAKGRTSIKIGRFLRAFYKDLATKIPDGLQQPTDKEIEEFVNLYKSLTEKESYKFKIVKGKEIAEYYDQNNYASERGTLGSSCMRDVNKDFFDLYCENPKVCNLLIYIDKNKEVIGRALVWKLSESPCDANYFMDRVYTAYDSDVNKFIAYADEKGWMYKYKMNSSHVQNQLFYLNGVPVMGKIEVELDADQKKYPFLDTLCFMNKKSTKISNQGYEGGRILNGTDGSTDPCFECYGNGKTKNGDVCDNCVGIQDETIYLIESGEFREYKKLIKKKN